MCHVIRSGIDGIFWSKNKTLTERTYVATFQKQKKLKIRVYRRPLPFWIFESIYIEMHSNHESRD